MPDDCTPLQIMVIDDDKNTRDALSMLLDSKYRVTLCSGALQALGYLREGALPDLIVLDLVMPEMTGWQFRIEQKKQPNWACIPVLALSGDHSPQAEAIDATAYLAKPVDKQVFLDTVSRLEKEIQEKREVARASELQRLVSLGSLVGGLAHEVNNPLAFIDGSLDLLQRHLVSLVRPLGPVDPLGVASALRALERAKTGVERITEVMRCVSMFASADATHDAPLDLHVVLESSLQVAANEIRHCARLERDYESVPMVLGNPAKLGQVFLNIILNAVRAIRGSNQPEHLISVKTRATAGWAAVMISDSASVLDTVAQKTMFDPLASASSARTGLHFGLAISREVVEAMGGSIEVLSKRPSGATLVIKLPSCSPSTYAPPATKPALLRPKTRDSIMVVDDDPLMCDVLEAMLSTDYEVSAFTSPRAALATMLESDVDLILCDVMMPELSGIDLYEKLARDRPELAKRLIFLTGGAFTERARMFLDRIARPVLSKPFSRRELVSTIEQTLANAERDGGPPVEGAGASRS